MKFNSCSANKIIEKGYRLEASKNNCYFNDGDRIILVCKKKRSLWVVDFDIIEKENIDKVENYSCALKVEFLKTWHERLGHQNINYV